MKRKRVDYFFAISSLCLTIKNFMLNQISTLPTLKNFTFRYFEHDEDYAKTLAVLKAANLEDGVEEQPTLEDHVHWTKHLQNFEPAQDFLIVEAAGQVVAYALAWWRVTDEGEYIHPCNHTILPGYRSDELQAALQTWTEARAQEKCVAPMSAPRYFQVWSPDTVTHRTRFLQARGYAVTRSFFVMLYKPLEHELPVSLPAHLEFREATPDHIRAVWEARVEAFRDHWGSSPQMATEESFNLFKHDPALNLDLWRIVWDKNENQIAGISVNFIFENDNKLYGFKRGWIASLGVRRPWRKHGVGRALLLGSLNRLREAGMTEAGLGVDAENPTGALKLYTSAGFKVHKRSDVYRKSF